MSITNTTKPASSSMTNTVKVSSGVTWDNWDVAWQDELRTWDELSSLMSSGLKPTASITNTPKP